MKTSLKITIWISLIFFLSILFVLEAIYVYAEDIPSVTRMFFYLSSFFIPIVLVCFIYRKQSKHVMETIDFLSVKSFLKIHFWSFIICQALILESIYIDKGKLLTSIWKNYYDIFPTILTWFVPFFISLVSYIIAYITTRKIYLREWNKENYKTNLYILTGCLLTGCVWSYMLVNQSGWIRGNTEYFINMLAGCFLAALSFILMKSSLLYVWEACKTNDISFKIYAAFYFSTLFLSSTFIISGIFNRIEGIDSDFFNEYLLYYILCVVGITLLLTLGILFNMWLTGHNKTFFFVTNIVLSILFLIPGLAVIKTKLFYVSNFIYSMRPQEYYEYDSSEFDFYTENAQEEDFPEPVDEDEKDDSYREVIQFEQFNLFDAPGTFTFDFLWDNPEDNQDSIQSALEYVKNHMHLTEEWSTLTDITEPDYFSSMQNKKGREAYLTIMQFLYEYRKREDLLVIARNYIPQLPNLISFETYLKTGMQTTVYQLLLAHRDILQGTNDFQRFAEIGKVMEENTKIYIKDEGFRERDKRFYQAIADITNAEDYTDKFLYYDGIEYERIVWCYSFWARRYDEGLHQDVYTILRNIQNLYAE